MPARLLSETLSQKKKEEEGGREGGKEKTELIQELQRQLCGPSAYKHEAWVQILSTCVKLYKN